MKYKRNGNIVLSGNNLMHELGIKLVPLFIYYCIKQIKEEFSFNLKKLLVKIISKKFELYQDDFYILRDYICENDISNIQKEINNYLENQKINDDGFLKCRDLLHLPSIEKIKLTREFRKINRQLTSRDTVPTAILFFTKKNHFENIEQEVPASHVHFDSWQHELKIAIPISRVSDENGPTEIWNNTSSYHFCYIKQYFVSWLQTRGLIKENRMNMIEESKIIKDKRKLTANPGDIILFNSRALHKAGNIHKGNRVILWLYF